MFSLWLMALILPSTLYFAVHCFSGRYESVENIQGDEETLFEYNLKLVGRDRLLNGTIINHVDLDEDFDVGLDLWTYKNGKWVPLNVNLYQKPCYFVKNTYATYFEKSIRDSNLPTSDNKCPFRKGEYFMKNVRLNTDNWPVFMQQGLKKSRVSMQRNGKVFGGFTVVMNLLKDSF